MAELDQNEIVVSQASPTGGQQDMVSVDASVAKGATVLDLGNAADLDVGTGAGTVAAGDDSRLTNDRDPNAHDLAGAKHGSATLAALNLKVSDATLDDSSAARTPSLHAATHEAGGADEMSIEAMAEPDALVFSKVAKIYKAAQLSWDPITGTMLSDTGFTGVRINVGYEAQVRFFNDTGDELADGTVINAQGNDATNKIFKGIKADVSAAATSSSISGIATHTIANGEPGAAVKFGEAHSQNTIGFVEGIIYASTEGDMTQERPKYPNAIIILGAVIYVHETEGVIFLDPVRFTRPDVSASVGFTSQGVSSGIYHKAGFYDWASTSVTLDEGSLTQTYGTAGRTYAAHPGVVPQVSGTVNTGQVGLKVTGIEDQETGIQVAAQEGIITEDITTLTADEMCEASEKFSGQVTFELYTVSGAPTVFSLTINYGYSKYEDFFNVDATIIGFQCQWQGGATDAAMNIRLMHHKPADWTFAASGFVAGNGAICERLVDQQLASSVANGIDGVYKRIELDTFVESGASEGIVIEVTTNANNTIQTMDMFISAVKESLN